MLARNQSPRAALHLRWALVSLMLGWLAFAGLTDSKSRSVALLRLSAAVGALHAVMAMLPVRPGPARQPGRGLMVALAVQLSCGVVSWWEPAGLLRSSRRTGSACVTRDLRPLAGDGLGEAAVRRRLSLRTGA